jgi:hypothetical protein
MTNEELFTSLNSCPYIHLISYEEAPATLDLRLIVHEARAEIEPSQRKTGNEELDRILGESYAIRSDPTFRGFTITFKNYVCFAIRNESYAEAELGEDFSKTLRTYSRSAFLDFIANSTCAKQIIGRPILHFSVICLDHVVDVACIAPPLIEITSIEESSGR